MAILAQNSGEPTCSSVVFGGPWDRTCRREMIIVVGYVVVAGRETEPLLYVFRLLHSGGSEM